MDACLVEPAEVYFSLYARRPHYIPPTVPICCTVLHCSTGNPRRFSSYTQEDDDAVIILVRDKR